MSDKLFEIKKAVPELHAAQIHQLVKDLAIFERMPEGHKISVSHFQDDLTKGHCHALVAVEPGTDTVLGYCLYYYAYSTWVGKFMFMEDLYVKESYRRTGMGTALWINLAQLTVSEGITRMQWNVLDWNQSAIDFYKRFSPLDLGEKEGWLTYRLHDDKLIALSQTSPPTKSER